MASKVWVCDDAGSTRYPVFTRGNVGEVFSVVASPLTWSAYGPHSWELGWRDAFYEMGVFTPDEFKPEGECEIVGCFGGYVYLNMSVTRVMAVRIPGLTIEAIDKSLFGDYPRRAAVPGGSARSECRANGGGQRLAHVVVQCRPKASDRSGPGPHRCADRAAAGFTRYVRRAVAGATSVTSERENRHVFKRHVLNTYGCNVLVSIIAQICQAAGAGELASQVTAAVGDVDSARQSFELWGLSRQVKSSPALAAAFDQGVDRLLERLRASGDPAARRLPRSNGMDSSTAGALSVRASGNSARRPTAPTPRSRCACSTALRRAPDSSAPSARAATLSARA